MNNAQGVHALPRAHTLANSTIYEVSSGDKELLVFLDLQKFGQRGPIQNLRMKEVKENKVNIKKNNNNKKQNKCNRNNLCSIRLFEKLLLSVNLKGK